MLSDRKPTKENDSHKAIKEVVADATKRKTTDVAVVESACSDGPICATDSPTVSEIHKRMNRETACSRREIICEYISRVERTSTTGTKEGVASRKTASSPAVPVKEIAE